MRIVVESWDGHDINDTNYHAYIPKIDKGLLNLADTTLIEVNRTDNFPVYAGKMLSGKSFVLAIEMLGTYSTQIDTLKIWFDTKNKTLKQLIFSDPGNSSKQWYLMCACANNPVINSGHAEFLLYAPDPVLQSVIGSTDIWETTDTGQTTTVTPGGNAPAKPVFTITPTSAKTGSYNYKRFVTVKNVHTNAFVDYPYDLTDGGWDTSALVKIASTKVQINAGGGITGDTDTIPYDNETGTLPTSGMAWIDGAASSDTEQIYYTGKTATDLTGVTRGINGTTAQAHADDIWIYQSDIQADGDDVRTFMDGGEVPRWFQGISTSDTKVWVNLNLSPKQATTIKTSIADTGLVPIIYLSYNAASYLFIRGAKSTGGIIEIGTELFTYTAIDMINYTLTGCIRATKGTSMAAHPAGDAITWIEHDIWLMYGNSAADAPTQSETKKPILKLTSTNASWIYEAFRDNTGLRSGSWKPGIISSTGKLSTYYTDNHNTNADPATEMGMVLNAFQVAALWKGETASIYWDLYHPAGITTVTSSGETYRTSTTWPAAAALQKGLTSPYYANQFNITIPATPAWTAWSKASEALGATYNYLRFAFSGSIGAVANNQAAFEVGDVTLTLDNAKRPTASMSAEQPNYWMSGTITNNTSLEWIKISLVMEVNTSVVIDCVNKTAVYNGGQNVMGGIEFSSMRQNWMDLAPGSNILQFDDAGTTGVTININYYDRNN